jgi:hypothetical protein
MREIVRVALRCCWLVVEETPHAVAITARLRSSSRTSVTQILVFVE